AVSLKLYAYPDFGLYIYRSKRFYLAIRCGSIGQNGNGGHAHNDQLSIELNIDGKDIISDPGTYLYTPLPERRNEYRSVKAHFAPQVKGREPANLNENLFKLGNAVSGECLYFGIEGFVGRHYGYGSKICFYTNFQECKLKILHIYAQSMQQFIEIPWMFSNFKNINTVYNFGKHPPANNFYSSSYGRKIAL
nr:heparinase II/III-family protein [Desulfobacterales bacterium]